VPDTLIRSNGGKPAACKSLNMAEGVCLSVCVPQVAKYQALLPQDTCAEDERCAPCVSPLDNMPTGACNIGSQPLTPSSCDPAEPAPSTNPTPSTPPAPAMCPHTGPPILDPNTLPSCGAGAHCLAEALVPAAMKGKLAACATGLCVPDTFIVSGGNFIPPTCKSVGDAEGRCLNVALPDVAKQAASLPQSSCATFEKCVPCYQPLDGVETGACRLSCDPGPQQPKVVFTDCCEMEGKTYGKCVPLQSIPDAEEKNLDDEDCVEGAQLCVPTEMLAPTFKPPTCTADNFLVGEYTGVCLSECLEFGIQGIAISRGSCDDLHKCAPCINPLTKEPTGAPGCPTS
jgi:hypothetical protein